MIEEATFVLLNLLFLSSNNWFRRLEEVILRTDGWKKGSSEKEKFQIVWKK